MTEVTPYQQVDSRLQGRRAEADNLLGVDGTALYRLLRRPGIEERPSLRALFGKSAPDPHPNAAGRA